MNEDDELQGADWRSYRRLLLSELRRLDAEIEKWAAEIAHLRDHDLLAIKIEMATQAYARKLHAAIVGAISGVASSLAIALIVALVRGWLKF